MLAVMTDSETLYERVGGEQFFETLTRHFYDTMSDDQVVRPLYPDEAEAYETARLQLKWFLMQYWGGPPVYLQRRGVPALRRRHAPYVIGARESGAWLHHMTEAVKAAHPGAEEEAELLTYFEMAATALVNAVPPAANPGAAHGGDC